MNWQATGITITAMGMFLFVAIGAYYFIRATKHEVIPRCSPLLVEARSSMDNPNAVCESCRWWMHQCLSHGTCHRRSPCVGSWGVLGAWPQTYRDGTCGDWERKAGS